MADHARGRADIAELLAKDAIRDTLYRELDARRRRDEAGVRACWAPGAEPELGFAASSLLASNCRVELEGRAARSSALVLAAYEAPPERGERTLLEALRFDDAWTLGADGSWRIASRRAEPLWRAWLDPRGGDRAGDHRHAEEWEK